MALRLPQPVLSIVPTDATILTRAIGNDELVLHYQPKVDLRTHAVVAVEALVRWQPPDGPMVFPDLFIPAVEEAGLMGDLTAAVVRKALDQYVEWASAGLYLAMAINVSASLLGHPRAVAFLADELSHRSINPGAVTVEITESVLMKDGDHASMAALHSLRAMGVDLSIDDFGTGYSSLAYLSRLPVTELKIDRSFVAAMTGDEDAAAIVRSTIGLGHALGRTVVAEGVEDGATYAALGALGCDLVQGYLVTRPLPAPAFTEWIHGAWPAQRAKLLTNVAVATVTAPDVDDLMSARARAFQRLTLVASAADVPAVLTSFVVECGGRLCNGVADEGSEVLPLDLGLGEVDPILPAAPVDSRTLRFLEESLPSVMESARRVMLLVRQQAP